MSRSIPEFQAKVLAAQTCEEMLAASMDFISAHGGFANCSVEKSRELRAKFLKKSTLIEGEAA